MSCKIGALKSRIKTRLWPAVNLDSGDVQFSRTVLNGSAEGQSSTELIWSTHSQWTRGWAELVQTDI